jgi:cell division septum initiation protein DivIVA
MKKTAKDIEIVRLKKQVEKLKSDKEVLKREKRSLEGKLNTAQAKADKYHDALKKKGHRKTGWTGKPSSQ